MHSLHELLSERRRELAERWVVEVQKSLGPTGLNSVELKDRIPSFIDELIASLHPSALPLPDASANAREHGVQRLRLGFNVSQVVREYGLLFRCILVLASERQVTFALEELLILNRALTSGVAEATSEYVWQRDQELRRQSEEHLGFLAHELRNPLTSARLALTILARRGQLVGRAAEALQRSIKRLSELLDNVLTSAWLRAGAAVRRKPVELRPLLEQLIEDAAPAAEGREVRVQLDAPQLTMAGDKRLLSSAISNALGNAIKFTREGSTVWVRAKTSGSSIVISVEDECGGLPPGKAEELLGAFVQGQHDKGGFGLGLAIARHAAEAHHGSVKMDNHPAKGCTVVFELPRGE